MNINETYKAFLLVSWLYPHHLNLHPCQDLA